jgi:hypothetical protein
LNQANSHASAGRTGAQSAHEEEVEKMKNYKIPILFLFMILICTSHNAYAVSVPGLTDVEYEFTDSVTRFELLLTGKAVNNTESATLPQLPFFPLSTTGNWIMDPLTIDLQNRATGDLISVSGEVFHAKPPNDAPSHGLADTFRFNVVCSVDGCAAAGPPRWAVWLRARP